MVLQVVHLVMSLEGQVELQQDRLTELLEQTELEHAQVQVAVEELQTPLAPPAPEEMVEFQEVVAVVGALALQVLLRLMVELAQEVKFGLFHMATIQAVELL